MSVPTTAVKNGIPTALATIGIQKAIHFSVNRNMDESMPQDTQAQLEGGMMAGVSAVAVDSTLRGQNAVVRSVACGGFLTLGMYAWKGYDDFLWIWLPTGAISYLLSDMLTAGM